MHEKDLMLFRKQLKSFYRRLQRELPVVSGLSLTTLQILFAVANSRTQLRPGDLCVALEMTNSNVAAALRTLEASGMVKRRDDPSDGRKAFVDITKRGSEVVAKTRVSHYAWLQNSIGEVLNRDEQGLLLQAGYLMQRLADHSTNVATGHDAGVRKKTGSNPGRRGRGNAESREVMKRKRNASVGPGESKV